MWVVPEVIPQPLGEGRHIHSAVEPLICVCVLKTPVDAWDFGESRAFMFIVTQTYVACELYTCMVWPHSCIAARCTCVAL